MAVVYEARHPRLGRIVALKVLKHGFVSAAWRRRFEHEAETIARLQHPGIAQLYESGVAPTDLGAQPYFAMELVRGVPADEYADGARLGRDQRLRLIIRICEAVHYAHQQGVIHRDIKPANVLVTEDGRPKVLDFGIARAVDRDATQFTGTGQIVGTLGHMSPEQASGAPIDTRTDVYALGVLAFRLLTGHPPHDLGTLPIARAIEVVRTAEPARPSTIDRSLRGDLETILLKSLAREPSQRYQSVNELGADIERFLTDQPILARAPSAWYQVRKFARRHRTVVGAGAAVAIVLVGAAAVSTLFGLSEARQRRETAAALEDLRLVTAFQQSMLERIDLAALGVVLADELRAQARRALAGEAPGARSAPDAFDESLDRLDMSDAARRMLAAHVLEPAVQAIDHEYADRPRVAASLRQSIGETYRTFGLFGPALAQTRAAYEARRARLGPDHLDTLWSMTALGLVLQEMGRADEAEPFYRESLERHRRVAGPDHWATLNTTQNLAVLLALQGRFGEALPLARTAADTYRRTAPDHEGRPATVNTLAFVLGRLGRHEDALAAARESLEAQRALDGDESWRTYTVRSNLGHFLRRVGQLEEAHEQHRAAVEGLRRLLGATHFRALKAEARLAETLVALDRAPDALERLEPVLDLAQTGAGAEVLVELRAAHGAALAGLGRLDEAESALATALEFAGRAPSPWVTADEIEDRLADLRARRTGGRPGP